MYKPCYSDTFAKIMKKLRKKDSARYDRVAKKMNEIVENPHVYKPLGNEMAGRRRVHFDPFVLVFSIDEENKMVRFLDFGHHDKIYKN